MYLKITKDIDNNVFSVKVVIDSYGTDELSEDEEREMLNDFPTKISYRNFSFSKSVKVDGNVPVVVDDGTDESCVVTLPTLSNKELILNENFEAYYKIDTNKISRSAINDILTTKELVAQAYCLIFETVIIEAVGEAMTSIRTKAPSFTGETLVNV